MRLTELASDLETLRADLAEELLSLNRYEAQLFSLSDETARDALTHLLEDKKGHVALLVGQLRRLDPKQRERLDREVAGAPEMLGSDSSRM